MKISDMGLKLIKAYEGYRPVDRELISGQRVVGYGHRLSGDKAVHLSKGEAEDLLRDDLAPFEDMLNEAVHAPLSQDQFDALCSLAFNIGPRAFLQSDVLRALNNGRPLDAANGFDIWRKSEIDGKVYVVDALMRRRAAEKALFLRLPKSRAASRVDLPPIPDKAAALLSTEDALPVFTDEDANGMVQVVPYDLRFPNPQMARRREDQGAGSLGYSETLADWDEAELLELNEQDIISEREEIASKQASTLIADAASELSEKLDALIDDADRETPANPEWPEALITTENSAQNNLASSEIMPADKSSSLFGPDVSGTDFPDADMPVPGNDRSGRVIDELAADDAMREGANSAAKYIEISDPDEPQKAGLTYWLTLLAGFTLFGASLAALLRGVEGWLDGWGPLLTFAGLILGGVMVLAAIYYAVKASLTKH